MKKTTDAKNVRQNKSRFFLIVEQILAFPSSTGLIKKVKNLSPCFKKIA